MFANEKERMDNKGITETGQVHDLRGNRLVFCFISRYVALSGMKRHRNFCIYFLNIILFKKCVSSKEYLQIYAIMGAKIDSKILHTVVSSYRFSMNFIWNIRYDKYVVVKKKKKKHERLFEYLPQTNKLPFWFRYSYKITMNINIIWLTFIREITRDSNDRFFHGVTQEINEAGEVIPRCFYSSATEGRLAHGVCVGKSKKGRRWSHHPHVAFCHIHATALTFKCIYRVHDSSGRSKLVSSVSSSFVPRVRVRGTNLGPK